VQGAVTDCGRCGDHDILRFDGEERHAASYPSVEERQRYDAEDERPDPREEHRAAEELQEEGHGPQFPDGARTRIRSNPPVG
jgi:hypothetical protein